MTSEFFSKICKSTNGNFIALAGNFVLGLFYSEAAYNEVFEESAVSNGLLFLSI